MSTDSSQTTQDVSTLSYEDARDELVAIVARIEGGSASLEESMELWGRGEALAAHCKAKLDQAQEQLDRAAPDGAAGEAEGSAPDQATGGRATDEASERTRDSVDEDDATDD